MKTILLSVLIFLCAIVVAQEPKKQIDSRIDNVTVFISGAQVMRKAAIAIPKGTTDLVFTDVSTTVNPQSIQVSTDLDFTVLAVNHQINYIQEQSKREEITKLEAQLKATREKLNYETAMLQVFQQEENMLIKNQAIGGSNVLLKTADLKEAMDFQRNRMTEVKSKQLEINQKITDYNKDITKMEQQLNELNAKNNKPSGEIVVTVMSKEAGTANIGLSYVVYNAGWYPSYDLRVTDISKPMYMKYKANVYQGTGEDWNNVKLALSSGNPRESGTKPNLLVWNLDYPVKNLLEGKVAGVAITSVRGEAVTPGETRITLRGNRHLADLASIPGVNVTEGQTSFRFEIEQPYSIPSDNKQHTVDVQERTVNATYEYYCVPKIDKDAFLTARITGWEEMNLLSGEANLYFEGTYLGKAALDTRNTKDTLELSLGRDKNIVVSRTKLKEFSRNQVLGSNKIDERNWEIAIRNKKQQPISITVEDQFPTSTNKEIVVERGDYKEGTLDDTTNKITWRLKIDPAKEKKIGFNYSVKSPKSASIVLE
ncbi:MAG: mucoidy inhibitor MuiA family protein [Bacteroidota bacterium]|nr:mucoidy inhibitor MuiA family protein [Bacteroidota bacterium]